MNNIKDIIEKIGAYQIFTNLLPGAFFCLWLQVFLSESYTLGNIGTDLVACYFIGYLINRLGSLVIEGLCKRIKLIEFSSYSDYIKAESIDAKIATLSETNSYLRSLLTSILLIPPTVLLDFLRQKWPWFNNSWKWFIIIIVILILVFSYKKNTDYIRRRVEIIIEEVTSKDKQ